MAEDGKSPAIGIDLGTTYSCVAVWLHGQVEIIVNGQGNRTTPSYVAFSGTDRLVGDAAKNQAARNPANTIFDTKRLIGRRISDPIVQADAKLWPFRVVDNGDDMPKVAVQYNDEEKQFTAVDISSVILSNMREIAEAQLGTAVKNAVVTVPAFFNNSQRQATKDAATAAGLEVLRIINEPTAAAIAYGFDKNRWGSEGKQKKVLVFDLGGGTFDVSILAMFTGAIKVIATAGDNHLGGVDLDNRLVQHCVSLFEKRHGEDITGDHKAIRRLKVACERAKRTLSFVVETMIEVDYLHDGIDFQCSINVAKFEELNMDLFKRCMELVDNCLQDAKMKKADIDEVLLVGGSTRIPKIQELLLEAFAESSIISKGINPDEAVASGAAIRAAMLGGNQTQIVDDLVLSDVTPLSLGVHTMGGLMSVLIPRNTDLPAQYERVFTTTRHGQTKIKVQVFEGERAFTRDNHLLGILELSGIQPAPIGNARITVTFRLDEDGILVVTAEDRQTNAKANITINRHSEGKSASEVERLVEEAEKHKTEDDKRKNLVLENHNLKEYASKLSDQVMLDMALKNIAEEEMEKATSGTPTWLKNNKMVADEQPDTEKRESEKKQNDVVKETTQKRSNRLRIWPWANMDR